MAEWEVTLDDGGRKRLFLVEAPDAQTAADRAGAECASPTGAFVLPARDSTSYGLAQGEVREGGDFEGEAT